MMSSHNPLHHPGARYSRLMLIVAACALTALALCAGATVLLAQQPVSPAVSVRPLPSLQPGDGVRLSFWRDPELNGDYFVDETGNVTLPLLGKINVSSVPADQLKRDLLRDLQAQVVNQSVQVILLTRIRIVGAVQRPGLYHIDPTMKVGDAVALAGGATPNGRVDRIRLVRGDQVVLSGLSTADPVLLEIRSGDQIIIPERSWIARNGAVVLGAVISAAGLIVAQAAF